MKWSNRRLGELADLVSGSTPSKARNDYWGGEIPWISAKDLKSPLLIDTELHVTEEGAAVGSKLMPADTIFFVVRGMSLANEFRVALSKVPATFNQDVKALIPRAWVSSNFLFYSLLAQRDLIRQRAGEASHGTKKLESDVVRSIVVSLPESIDVQRRVGSIAELYDLLIVNNERRIELLERSARLLFDEWFIRPGQPGFENNKVRGGVPEGWTREYVPDIIEINPRERVESGKELLYIPMAALSQTNMTIDWSRSERRSKYTSVRFRNGDTLVARITPCLKNGKTGFVAGVGNNEVACGSTEFIVLRGKSVSPWFVYCLARSQLFRETAIKSMTGSSGRQRVNESCFDEFKVLLAPNKILKEFDRFASACFDQIKLLDAQRQRLNRARDILLPRLMDGRISV
jgi:type I restriction enzyme S subunit